MAISVTAEIGVDITQHQSKTFADLQETSFSVIISLTPEAYHWSLELTQAMFNDVEYWPTPDPDLIRGSYEQKLYAYRNFRDELITKIMCRFGEPALK